MTDLDTPGVEMESLLQDLAERLAKQEETSRRLEATLLALVNMPATTDLADVTETPKPTRTPLSIPWPARRGDTEANRNGDEGSIEGDLLWAVGGLIPEALIGLDADGIVRMWNPAAEAVFGWMAEEVLGRPLPIVPHDQIAEHEHLCRDARSNQPRHGIHVIRQCKDGRLLRAELSIAGVRSGVAITVRPVVMPNRSTVVEHSRPGPIPTDLHLHGLAAVGRQVAAVTHDFNNLLTIIGGSIECLLSQFDHNDTRRSVIEMLDHATKQSRAICRNLLDLARIDAPPKDVQDPICDLSAVVASHATVLEGLIGSERALVLSLAEHPVEIAADPVRIGQVLINLASNSRDAMPDGGTLAVEVEIVKDSEHGLKFPGPAAVLTVSDTGYGMNQETMTRAFEPFFTTKPPGQGTGLGLANVAEIVSSVGGVVVPESSPGTGTTIRIYFPLSLTTA